MTTRSFTIEPQGAFSLSQSIAFGFGQREAEQGDAMRLAFAVDGDHMPAGVLLRQSDDGVVHGELHGDAPLDAVRSQVARILSLDHDARPWDALLEREAPLGALAAQLVGLRPVLFHSPYEAAAWSIISARRYRGQAAKTRDQLSATLGTTFELGGELKSAFPTPAQLLQKLEPIPGLPDTKVARLHGVATAALDGDLDADHLQAIGPDAATERLLELQGIGPFYASLIVIRATGFTDVLPVDEPQARPAAGIAYGLGHDATLADWEELSERWRPFRTWATVLLRVAVSRGLARAESGE